MERDSKRILVIEGERRVTLYIDLRMSLLTRTLLHASSLRVTSRLLQDLESPDQKVLNIIGD